ncbi:IdgA domain-containing protein [Pseudovirgaria hyperparasitica]|uniref:IdgA domain-containing protein n=1 Tax=Pseudovirgaria hyperparasitica TaxID=470096 RepID=A0A6A6WBB9_9PEZI|nr:IdgA domain-containing protein [Pseudovirgaria hyperparasitica]KAF2760132.1 IdgA domain-containing protein [Pseudovirgaria hyperparasitica]
MAMFGVFGRTSALRCTVRQASSIRWRHASTKNNSFIRVHDEVREALNSGKPVVALETTIYTHGFPYPDNVALASHLESIVRVNGGVPATIGVIDGVARVGLDAEELIRLTASAGKDTTLKLSRRDLSYVCGMRLVGKNFNGGTTIAGTMVLAHLAGIKVFATGGLGGVHRGAESSMDISADLTELGRTPVAVVSSGCKSFLDIGRTIEYLETEGAGVGTFADGRQGNVDFPAFWSRDSGVKSPVTIQDEIEAAAIIHAQNSLGIKSGLVFANPIPEEFQIPKAEMDLVIAEAIKEAEAAGAYGNANTPYILNKIKELTKGNSIPANRALIESNVRRGTIVARELGLLEANERGAETGVSNTFMPSTTSTVSVASTPSSSSSSEIPVTPLEAAETANTEVIVAGALAVDFACDYTPFSGTPSETSTTPQLHTSNPSRITQTLGGVGHNIAKALHYLGSSVSLCTAIGDDLSGHAAVVQLQSQKFSTEGIKTLSSASSARTAQYIAVNDANKDLMLAMADMTILEDIPSASIPSLWPSITDRTFTPACVVVDGNWSRDAAHTWLRAGKAVGATTAFEPVSTSKAARFLSGPAHGTASDIGVFPQHIVDIATPNQHELAAMHATAQQALLSRQDWWEVIDALGISSSGLRTALTHATNADLVDQGIPQMGIQLLPFIPTILTKLGPKGVLLTSLLPRGDERLHRAEYKPYVLSRTNVDGSGVGGVYMRLFEPPEVLVGEDVVSVNGVGDTFLGAVVAGILKGRRVEEVVGLAQRAAGLTLRSKEAVSPELRSIAHLF